MHLKPETHRYQKVREALLEEWPDLDPETLADTLEGITDLHEMIAAVIRSALVDEALQAGLRMRLEEMRRRLSRLEDRGAKKRQLALEAMSEVGLKKLDAARLHRLRPRRVPRPVVVSRGGASPEATGFLRPRSSTGRHCLRALKRGEAIPGAQLSNPKPVLIREDEVMAFTEVANSPASKPSSTRSTSGRAGQRHRPQLRRRLARHRRGEPHLRLRRLGPAHTLDPLCLERRQRPHHAAAYTARVRICVRAGDIDIAREGSRQRRRPRLSTPGEAHELALKGAETDATKRALATFGNPFGLALYDRELAGVTNRKALMASSEERDRGPWVLSLLAGEEQSFDRSEDYVAALRKALNESTDIEALFALWERNVETVRAINRHANRSTPGSGIAHILVAQLKGRAIALAKHGETSSSSSEAPAEHEAPRKIDKSQLAIPEVKRSARRSTCGTWHASPAWSAVDPSHAHHVRYAQPRGLGLKVSDEFTVPLCAIHHREMHQTTRETDWWRMKKIDPLAVAAALWRETSGARGVSPGASETTEAGGRATEVGGSSGSQP